MPSPVQRARVHATTSPATTRASRASQRRRDGVVRASNHHRFTEQRCDEDEDKEDDDVTTTTRRGVLRAATAVSGLASFNLPHAPGARATTEISYEGQRRTAYAFDAPLKVVALRQSFPSSASSEFSKTQGSKVKFSLSTAPNVADVYSNLVKDGKRTKGADAVTLGDEWLAPAVANGLIRPIPNAESSRWFNALPPIWRAVVRRDPKTGEQSSNGMIYGAPYRFGCATIAYRKDKLPKGVKPPRDWEDLFDPRLRGLIGMPNAPRLVLSAALKAEGMSVNSSDLGGVDGRVSDRVRFLRQNVKIFDDLQYLQALACGDCAVAVGPSEEIFSIARRSTLIGLVVPKSGTTLWSDVWAVPSATARNKGGGPSPALEQWIDYTLQPARINMRVGLKGGISPLMYDGRSIESGYDRYPTVARPALGGKEGDMLEGWIPDDSIWAASEFQLPLSERARLEYVTMSRFITG